MKNPQPERVMRARSQGIMGQHQIHLQDMPKLLIILSFVMEIYLGKKNTNSNCAGSARKRVINLMD
jgi:hypothetical protein